MQTINLNQNSFRLFPTIYMVQNDTGRELKMILDDVTLDGTETGAVAIKRSDGSYYTITATIDATNNAFDADMTQALTQPSRTECQLKVTASDDTVISTYTFIIMVQPSTDGISEEQLGYSVQDIINAAAEIMNTGLSDAVKQALLQIAAKAVYVDDGGPQYYAELAEALNPTRTLTSIDAVYTQSGTVYTTDSLDSLKPDLVVTAHYSDGSTATVTGYTLSGELTAGTSTITVSYGGQSDTFTVTVTRYVFYDYIYNNVSDSSTYDNYVDTGIVRSNGWSTLNVEFEAENNNNAAGAVALFGANNTTASYNGNTLWYARANKGGFSAYNLGQAKQLSTVPGDTRAVCKYVFVDGGQSYMEWNGTVVNVAIVSASSITGQTRTLLLAGGYAFSGNNEKYGIQYQTAKLGYVKFTDPSTSNVLYNFVPAEDIETGKVGYYDTVNNVFYQATGTAYALGNWT